jgi:DinB family protein
VALSRTERAALIERYTEGPRRLRAALATVPPAALQWRPRPGEWSAHEIVCHCADSESHASLRIRTLVTEREPVIVGYDQERWAQVLDYHAHPIETALAVVDAVRASTAALLARLDDAAWSRAGRHTESGHYTAESWLQIYSAHVHDHADQIDGNVAQWTARS